MFARERANSGRAIGEVPGALCRQPWTKERGGFPPPSDCEESP